MIIYALFVHAISGYHRSRHYYYHYHHDHHIDTAALTARVRSHDVIVRHCLITSLLKSSNSNDNNNDNQVNVKHSALSSTPIDTTQIWSSRRKISNVALSPFVGYVLDKAEKKKKQQQQMKEKEEQQGDSSVKMGDTDDGSSNQGLLVSAFIIAGTAVALRLGGRGAFVQLLGLDFIADSDIKGQIDTFIQYFQSLDGLRYLYFFFAWLVVKGLCIDALTIGTYTHYTTLHYTKV